MPHHSPSNIQSPQPQSRLQQQSVSEPLGIKLILHICIKFDIQIRYPKYLIQIIQAHHPPSVIFNMQLIDLESFKTKKCDKTHPETPLSVSNFSCSGNHSRQDKRRNPFANGKAALIYSQIYVEDYYSTQMASNLIQYLFHPNVYKTILCSHRFITNYEEGPTAQQCKNQWCPFLHSGQDVSPLAPYRNLPLLNPLEDTYCEKIQQCSQLTSLLKGGDMTDFSQQIANFKTHLQAISKATEQQAVALKVEPPLPLIPAPAKLAQPSEGKGKQNWYTEYQYFHFGQKVPIIEGRHIEFKNYRDIVTNNIAPIVMKYISAFLNSDGGVLYVGIDDSSIVYGFQMTQNEYDRFLLNLDGEGKRTILPPLLLHKYSVRRIPVYHKKGKELWAVQIKVTPSEKDKKNRVLTTYNREAYIRMNASTQKLDAINLIQYIRYGEEQKQEERRAVEVAQELAKILQRREPVLTVKELVELKERLGKVGQRVEQLLAGRRREGE